MLQTVGGGGLGCLLRLKTTGGGRIEFQLICCKQKVVVG